MTRSRALVAAASLGAVLVAVASSGGVFSGPGPAEDGLRANPSSTTTATVLGRTVTRSSADTTASSPAPAVTVTTVDAFAAALAAATPPPAASTTSATTAATSPTPPASMAPVSASSTAPGLTLVLEATSAAAGRSVDLRLAAHFDDLRVLRAAHVDFGDGTAVDGAVQPWTCRAPDAPNPYVLTVPTHVYRAGGSYMVVVSATTAACSPDDDDWGPDEPAEVRLTLAVP